MSRVGNSPILIPEGVNVQINPKDVIISGKLGSLTQTYDTISVEKKENQLTRMIAPKQRPLRWARHELHLMHLIRNHSER